MEFFQPATWHVALGRHAIEFIQTSVIIGILLLVSILTISPHAVDMSFRTSLRNFVQIGQPSADKNDVVSIFKMADFCHLGF